MEIDLEKHTDTPWRVSGKQTPYLIEGAMKGKFSTWICNDVMFKANAEFICRACNSYDSLVEALEAIIKEADDESVELKTPIAYFKPFDKARQALAKAKVKGDA